MIIPPQTCSLAFLCIIQTHSHLPDSLSVPNGYTFLMPSIPPQSPLYLLILASSAVFNEHETNTGPHTMVERIERNSPRFPDRWQRASNNGHLSTNSVADCHTVYISNVKAVTVVAFAQ